MQNQFIHAGVGRDLRKTTALTGNIPEESLVIEDGECTESVAAHDGQELLFGVYIGVDSEAEESGSGSESEESGSGSEEAAGDIVIERSGSPDFAEYDTHETVDVTGLAFYSWAAGERMLGFYRVRNDSGVPISVKTNSSIT